MTLQNLTVVQREALADLFGRDRLPESTARISLAALARALDVADFNSIRGLVEALEGPLGNQRERRKARRASRQALWTWVTDEAAKVPLLAAAGGPGPPAVERWVGMLRRTGIRGGESAFQGRVSQVLAVLAALPEDGGMTLAAFAADYLGDPHGLDRGSAVEALVLDALSVALDVDRPRDAESVRELWERVGVAPDPLSSTVCVLGLAPYGADPLTCWLREAAAASEPVVMTLAQLRRWPVAPLAAGSVVFVVENPSLVASAAGLGWTGPPIVCSSGRPSVAVTTLLRNLAMDGAACLQHADFDAGGLGITRWLASRAGTVPWLMTASAYRGAVARGRQRLKLPAVLPDTPWDPELASVMHSWGAAVYEEELRKDLLAEMSKVDR
ncbi:MAG: TIGR02679 family protein [Actinomycetota bacterium]|nr:TIGR02679 family protein [Actinomycetota bacterium]